MARYGRAIVLLGLLGTLLLNPMLGCSFSIGKEISIGNLTPEVVEEPTATAPPATATIPAKTATPESSETPVEPAPTQPPASPTPTVSASQTITQDIVIHNVGDDGVISYESTFTMTASIQVGMVDGVEYTAESVPMPEGVVPYDRTQLPEIGDVVEQAEGVIVQVLGVETREADANNEFVLVDVIVGNAGDERQLVAMDPCMEIVSGDGHWYSPFWYTLYWAGTGGAEHMTAMAAELQQKMLEAGITTYWSAALEPGEAARGTAAFMVPKSAKQLAFGFQTYLGATYLMFNNEVQPTVLVPLGLRGDFPALPVGAEALEAGETYSVGDSFEAPKRGVSLQVQSAWARQEALGAGRELEPDEQFVIVHLFAPTSGDARPLDPARELALMGAGGERYELQEYTADWLTLKLGPYNQRGVLVFKGPRETSGLTLEFNPLDPATMDNDSPKPLAREAVTIDLGELAVAEPAMITAGTPGEGGAKPTSTSEPAGAYELGDQVEVGDLAITLNGWGTASGPEDFEAGEGQTWLTVYVTIENVGRQDAEVDPQRFDFVLETGEIHNALWNAPSVWDEISPHVLEYGFLKPGDTLQDRLLVILIEEAALTGLKLRYTAEDGEEILWDLGL